MNIEEVKQLISDYTKWLIKEIVIEKIGEVYEITTPLLDSNNDYIQIYIKLDNDKILFSDDGLTLYMRGFEETPANKKIFLSILRQYGITLNGSVLETSSDVKDFDKTMHMFLQSIIRVDDICTVLADKDSKIR